MNLDLNKDKLPLWKKFHTIVFDFDGVFTNNHVYVDCNKNEFVNCNRSDGYGLDILKRFRKINNWDLNYFILSTEVNNVVNARANKMKIKSYNGVNNKKKFITNYLKIQENNLDLEGLVYLGNDLNDFQVMEVAGLSIAPSDAHPIINNIADYVFDEKGGDGFVRAFIEKFLRIDELSKEDFKKIIT